MTGTGNDIDTDTNIALDLNGVTIGAGGITFATVDKNAAGGAVEAIDIDTVATTGGGTLTVASSTVAGTAGAAAGIDISAMAAAVTFTTVSINNTGGAGIALTGNTGASPSTAAISARPTTRPASASTSAAAAPPTSPSTRRSTRRSAGDVIEITGRTGGTVDFNAAITSTGGGIDINTNTGGTVRFDGGLNLSTAAAAAFNASNGALGGTVVVTDPGGGNNVLATTTGTALNVVNVNIGAEDLTFESISKNGTGTGIVLNNTGASGSLTVTGDAGSANNNSGGTIQNATIGISLTDTRDVVMEQMNIHDTTQNGIDGFRVTNFSLTNSKVETTGTASIAGDFEVNAISFMDRSGANDNTLDGTVTITGNTITNPERNGISIETFAGTISNVNISNNMISGGTTNARIQDAVHVFAMGTTGGITTGAISNNAISDFRFLDTVPVIDVFIGGNGIRLVTDTNAVNPASTLGTGPNPFVISGNDIDNVGSNMIAVTAVGRTASANVRILNNGTVGDPMDNAEGLGISLFFGGNGTFNGLVHNNVIQDIDQGGKPVRLERHRRAVRLRREHRREHGRHELEYHRHEQSGHEHGRQRHHCHRDQQRRHLQHQNQRQHRHHHSGPRRAIRHSRPAQQHRHAAGHQPRDARQRHRGRQPGHRASRWDGHPAADRLHVLHRGD